MSEAHHVRECGRKADGGDRLSCSLDIVGHPPNLCLHRRLARRAQNDIGGAGVSILGPSDRTHTYEERLSISTEPRVVGMPKGKDIVRLSFRQSQVGPFVPIA